MSLGYQSTPGLVPLVQDLFCKDSPSSLDQVVQNCSNPNYSELVPSTMD